VCAPKVVVWYSWAVVTNNIDLGDSTIDICLSQLWRLEVWHQVLAVLGSGEGPHPGGRWLATF
jgi:hypothetical protein